MFLGRSPSHRNRTRRKSGPKDSAVLDRGPSEMSRQEELSSRRSIVDRSSRRRRNRS